LLQGDRTSKLQAYLQDDRLQGFALDRPRLMRLALFRMAETEYELIWTYHNTLMQGVWALLLSRYADAQDVVFGVVCDDRPIRLSSTSCRANPQFLRLDDAR
jgi:hypothetical protein